MREEGCARPLAAWIRRVTNEDCTTAKAADRWRAAKEKIEDKWGQANTDKIVKSQVMLLRTTVNANNKFNVIPDPIRYPARSRF